MNDCDHDMMGGWGWIGALSGVLLLAVLIAAIIVAIRYLTRTPTAGANPPAAETILAERYARGEMDEQEYRQRIQVLRGHPRSQ